MTFLVIRLVCSLPFRKISLQPLCHSLTQSCTILIGTNKVIGPVSLMTSVKFGTIWDRNVKSVSQTSQPTRHRREHRRRWKLNRWTLRCAHTHFRYKSCRSKSPLLHCIFYKIHSCRDIDDNQLVTAEFKVFFGWKESNDLIGVNYRKWHETKQLLLLKVYKPGSGRLQLLTKEKRFSLPLCTKVQRSDCCRVRWHYTFCHIISSVWMQLFLYY